jgi:RNA polymerase sigma-70 factor (ECF subfamily)
MATVELGERLKNDIDLVHRMAAGDTSAARLFYQANCDALFGFVVRRTKGSIEDAEEIANDTFLSAFDLAHSFDGSCSVLTWLCSLAQYRIIDYRRKANAAKRIPEDSFIRIDDYSKQVLRSIHDPAASMDDIVEQLDRVRIVQSLLQTMTPDQREAVTMRYVEGFSVDEISKIMKKSTKAVERLLERAKDKPRREMLHLLGEDGFTILCLEVLII